MAEIKLPAIKDKDFSTIKFGNDGFKLSVRERELAYALVMKPYTKDTNNDIAERLGISVDTLFKIPRRNPDFEKFQDYLIEHLFSELYGKSVAILHDIMDNSPNQSLKLKAAQLVLQAHGKLKADHTVRVEAKPAKTLAELEKEQEKSRIEVQALEKELLED